MKDSQTNQKNSNVIPFPRTVANLNRDMDKVVDASIDLLERSSALLRLAEEWKNDNKLL